MIRLLGLVFLDPLETSADPVTVVVMVEIPFEWYFSLKAVASLNVILG